MMTRTAFALLLLSACAPAAPAVAPGAPSPEAPPAPSYDPPGSTITIDRPIEEAPRRTIGSLRSDVWFSNEMEGGRLNDVQVVDDSSFVALIRPENAPINNSAWYAFKTWSAEPRTVTLRLTYEGGRHRYWPRTRGVGQEWTPLPVEAVAVDAATNSAVLRLRVGPDTLWVAAQELVTSSVFARWTDSLAARPHVRSEQIGTSRLGRPIHMLTITDAPDADRLVMLISRQHPPEVTGTFALKRFVEELAADSPLARRFRERFQVLVVPLVNPDGVDLGHWRHNTGGVDLNRDWQAFNQPETRAVRDALLAAGRRPRVEVWFAADFHSTGRDVFYSMAREYETQPEGLMDRWLERIARDVPGYQVHDEPSGPGTPVSKNWFYETFRAPSVTYEVGDRTDRALIHEVATAGARALMELLLEEAETNPVVTVP
jgi:cytosolic carboxypeptidase protein 6